MPQRVEGSIEIEAPVGTVYEYWETLENLPNFMANVEEVRPTGPDTTHWRVKGPLGRTLEWEATTTQREPNQALGWNSTEGEVGTSGQVRFREAAPNRTRVEVQMNYSDPPGGKVGEVASRVVANPKLQLEQDLRNLKQILEGRATPEEIQRQPAATTVQSGVAAFLTSGAGLLLLGAGVILFLLLRRRSGGSVAPPRGKRRIILEL
ncbi:MAG: SRPBCC family protein [Actinomycetota bacterium]|nr:SRPBCC family protein [Actinomycetota bacterium]